MRRGAEKRSGAEPLTHLFTYLDARFEVVGAPYSLLSATLSASQRLYTRRGTLVGLSGKADNVRTLDLNLSFSHILWLRLVGLHDG